MYPRIPCELVADPLESTEYSLGTDDLDECKGNFYTCTRYNGRLFMNDYEYMLFNHTQTHTHTHKT
jgi:hypothetical protein